MIEFYRLIILRLHRVSTKVTEVLQLSARLWKKKHQDLNWIFNHLSGFHWFLRFLSDFPWPPLKTPCLLA